MENNVGPVLAKIQEMAASFLASLPNLAIALIVLILFWLAANMVGRSVKRVNERLGRSPNLGSILSLLARWGVLLAGILIAWSVVFPSFPPGNLIEVLGIASVAIGFAFRDIFQNFLAGIIILLTEPFRIGDQIIVNSDPDLEGTVEDIETRATIITTYDNRRIVIPNAIVFANAVTVNTAHPSRRSEHDFGIDYGDDIDRARQIVLQAMQEVEGVLAHPAADVLVVALGDSSVDLRARWWTDSRRGDVVRTESDVVQRIKMALDQSGIEIPFPTQIVYLHNETQKVNGAPPGR